MTGRTLTRREMAAARFMLGVGVLTGATFVLVMSRAVGSGAGAAVLVPGVVLVADGLRALRG